MDITKSKGNLTELMCMMKFMEYGFDVSIPYGDSSKYDFIVDLNGELVKIQCKTSSPENKNGVINENVFSFSTMCQTTNTQKTTRHKYTKEQIDYFATSYQGKVYVVPVDECSTSKTLRLVPPQNNQKYNDANDYLMEKVFEDYIDQSFKEQKAIQREKKKYYCTNCGAEIATQKAKRCIKCAQLFSRKAERPSREELKELIRNNSFISIGEKYDVSDNAVRKWCEAMKLPTKKSEIKKYSDKEWSEI